MATQRSSQQQHRRPKRRPHWGLWILLLAVVAFGLALLVPRLADTVNEQREQAALAPFYEPPPNYQLTKPGTLLKSEPMDMYVPGNGQAVRMLYRSEREDGTPTVSSGMVFFPAQDADVADRPLVAWAHGTIGLGDSCAPSRSSNPLSDMDWLGQMLERGWVVTATDYAGLGTPGESRYLIGGDEARDVLNSVRAARGLDREAGTRYAVFGHSQGGHAVLWAAAEAASYAPELTLAGTAAGAPAAELQQLFARQYDTAAGWVIGPDVATTWPSAYPNLDVTGALTKDGERLASKIARECVQQSATGGLLRETIGERFFSQNPMELPSWREAASQQTPQSLRPTQPLLVIQSTTDQVVLPETTSLYIDRSCHAGSTLETLWVSGITHQDTVNKTGPSIVDWIGERFEGKPFLSSCGQPLPVKPAS